MNTNPTTTKPKADTLPPLSNIKGPMSTASILVTLYKNSMGISDAVATNPKLKPLVERCTGLDAKTAQATNLLTPPNVISTLGSEIDTNISILKTDRKGAGVSIAAMAEEKQNKLRNASTTIQERFDQLKKEGTRLIHDQREKISEFIITKSKQPTEAEIENLVKTLGRDAEVVLKNLNAEADKFYKESTKFNHDEATLRLSYLDLARTTNVGVARQRQEEKRAQEPTPSTEQHEKPT